MPKKRNADGSAEDRAIAKKAKKDESEADKLAKKVQQYDESARLSREEDLKNNAKYKEYLFGGQNQVFEVPLRNLTFYPANPRDPLNPSTPLFTKTSVTANINAMFTHFQKNEFRGYHPWDHPAVVDFEDPDGSWTKEVEEKLAERQKAIADGAQDLEGTPIALDMNTDIDFRVAAGVHRRGVLALWYREREKHEEHKQVAWVTLVKPGAFAKDPKFEEQIVNGTNMQTLQNELDAMTSFRTLKGHPELLRSQYLAAPPGRPQNLLMEINQFITNPAMSAALDKAFQSPTAWSVTEAFNVSHTLIHRRSKLGRSTSSMARVVDVSVGQLEIVEPLVFRNLLTCNDPVLQRFGASVIKELLIHVKEPAQTSTSLFKLEFRDDDLSTVLPPSANKKTPELVKFEESAHRRIKENHHLINSIPTSPLLLTLRNNEVFMRVCHPTSGLKMESDTYLAIYELVVLPILSNTLNNIGNFKASNLSSAARFNTSSIDEQPDDLRPVESLGDFIDGIYSLMQVDTSVNPFLERIFFGMPLAFYVMVLKVANRYGFLSTETGSTSSENNRGKYKKDQKGTAPQIPRGIGELLQNPDKNPSVFKAWNSALSLLKLHFDAVVAKKAFTAEVYVKGKLVKKKISKEVSEPEARWKQTLSESFTGDRLGHAEEGAIEAGAAKRVPSGEEEEDEDAIDTNDLTASLVDHFSSGITNDLVQLLLRSIFPEIGSEEDASPEDLPEVEHLRNDLVKEVLVQPIVQRLKESRDRQRIKSLEDPQALNSSADDEYFRMLPRFAEDLLLADITHELESPRRKEDLQSDAWVRHLRRTLAPPTLARLPTCTKFLDCDFAPDLDFEPEDDDEADDEEEEDDDSEDEDDDEEMNDLDAEINGLIEDGAEPYKSPGEDEEEKERESEDSELSAVDEDSEPGETQQVQQRLRRRK